MTDRLDVLSPASFDPLLVERAASLLCRVWPKPGRTVASRSAQLAEEFASYAGPPERAPRGFLVTEQGEAIAYAAILPREIACDGRRVVIAGLARVCTAPERRGRGLGERVVRTALALVDEGHLPWSLFQTTQAVRPFYERIGAVLVGNRIVNSLADDPQANPFWDELAMRYPAKAPAPEGVIDLLGPGF
jgi:GNAT superfamily N-acetyltransferase